MLALDAVAVELQGLPARQERDLRARRPGQEGDEQQREKESTRRTTDLSR